jgi:hypothetical protein
MKSIITSLLAISLLVVVPNCCKRSNKCTAVYIDTNNELQKEELASLDSIIIEEEDIIVSSPIKC